MGGSIFCNKVNDRVQQSSCKSCKYAEHPPGWSMTHCTYNLIKHEERTGKTYDRTTIYNLPPKDELRQMERRAAWLEESMNRAYKQGRTRKGDGYAWGLAEVQRKIKKLKEES